MRFNGSSDVCSSDVLIEREPLRALSGPVTRAAVTGVCVALTAAALVCVCYRRRFQGLRRRLLCEQPGDCDSDAQREDQETEPAAGGPAQVHSDVAAFALTARVVYPISQRYRPLADGASNPSLHEKYPAPPNQDSASSSADDWLSQERDDDDSSQFISCSPAFKAQTCHLFRRVQQYPHTLGHSRTSLLSLTLQELQLHTTQLQQEKYRMFLKILQLLLRERETDDIIYVQQERDVQRLKRQMPEDEEAESEGEEAESHTVMCSTEEVERTGRHRLDQSLQTALSFAKQLERLCQSLRSRFSGEDAQEVMRMLMKSLQLVESVLAEIQASVVQTLMDRFEWWAEVSDWLREKTALLKQEAELVVKLTGQSVQQLRADGQLEKLSEFQTLVNEELLQWTDEIRRQTEELALKHCEKVCVRRRRMMKAQSSDWSVLLSDTHTHAHHLLQVLVELQVTHWNQWRDFEIQQDARITDTLCERWKSLFGNCSRRFTDLSTEYVESIISTGSAPSLDLCQSVLKIIKLTVTNQMEQEERHAKTHLQLLQEQLQRCRQVWIEEEALTLSCLNHFGEQQRKITMTMVSRHSDMQESCDVIEELQHLLILEFQRILAARSFYLRTVREMQLTHIKTHAETQDPCVCVSHEAAVIGQNLQHEQLSELETAADMLQEHAHFLFGHALARTARLRMSLSAGDAVRTDRCVKEGLIDAVCESVFATRDSVLSLICEYYTRIQHVGFSTSQQQRPYTDTDSRVRTRALQTELNNWSRNPNSTELQERIVELKTKCLSEFQKQRHNPVQRHTYRQELADEEEAFVCRLAALARVSLNSISKEYSTDLNKISHGSTATLQTS